MKLASFVHQGIRSYGIVKADGVINLGRRLGDRYSDLKSLLAANALNEAQQLSGETPDLSFDAGILPVIDNPGKFFASA
jgi:hypothetical protein